MNARKLHSFLEVGKQFSHWIQDRIDQYNFNENVDFVTFSQNGLKGRPSFEYHLSLNMAKELAMLERSQKGQEARQYFIQCEKKAVAANSAPALPDFDTPWMDDIAWVVSHARRAEWLEGFSP